MKLYICWGTFPTPRPGGHPCKNAHDALVAAGHNPEVVKSYGLGYLPDVVNQSPGRKAVKAATGSSMVPALELEDGTWISGSREIADWAGAHPA